MPGGVEESYFLPADTDINDDDDAASNNNTVIANEENDDGEDILFEPNLTASDRKDISSKVLNNLCTSLNLVENLLNVSKPFAAVGFKKVEKPRSHENFVNLKAIGEERKARRKVCEEKDRFVFDRLRSCVNDLRTVLDYLDQNPNHCQRHRVRSPIIWPTDVWEYRCDKPICWSRDGERQCRCSCCCSY